MAPRYKVTLTKEERLKIEAISTKEKTAVQHRMHARALLCSTPVRMDPSGFVGKVAKAVGTTTRSFEHLKKDLLKKGFQSPLNVRNS